MSDLAPTAISRPRQPDTIPGYRLLDLVGRGGMGEVHAAMQLSLGRKVAIKMLAANLASDAAFIARFEKEAAALAALSHPHVVAIVDKGQADGTYFLVMEFVTGPSLRELMKEPDFNASTALRAMLEVTRAIEYAHKRGVIHRDLKPENILFDEPAGRVTKVTDFGLAAIVEGDAARRFEVTGTHVAMGTASYMAPEQRTDARSADHRADLYAIGVMLYETLTGQLPAGSFAPASHLKSSIDPRLDPIIERCLKQAPTDRYASAAELIAALEPLAPHGFTGPPQKLSPGQRAVSIVRKVGRSTARGSAVALVVAAAIVLVVTAVRNTLRTEVRIWPGAEVAGELGPEQTRSWSGRVSDQGLRHQVTAGDGPDVLALLTAGRDPAISPQGLTFDRPDPHAPLGRALLDLTEVEGDHCRAVTQVAYSSPQDWRTSLRRTVLGVIPEPRASLLLMGSAGRYAALVVGPPGNPVSLEWVLGEKRGAMIGMPSPSGSAALDLEVGSDGDLRAFVGAGSDRRPVGEPITLGKEWQKAFGRMPRPAVGCLDGLCSFSSLVFTVEREPPPPPPAPTPPPAPVPPPVVAVTMPPVVATPHVDEPEASGHTSGTTHHHSSSSRHAATKTEPSPAHPEPPKKPHH